MFNTFLNAKKHHFASLRANWSAVDLRAGYFHENTLNGRALQTCHENVSLEIKEKSLFDS